MMPTSAEPSEGLLEGQNFAVAETSEGRVGVDCFDETHPDLVILDEDLPDLDCWEVLGHIRTMSDDVGVLMLSNESEAAGGPNVDVDGEYLFFIPKPISRAWLVANAVRLTRDRQPKEPRRDHLRRPILPIPKMPPGDTSSRRTGMLLARKDPSVAVIRRECCALVRGGSQIVRVPGFEPWPLRGWTTAWPLPQGLPLGRPAQRPGRVPAPRPAHW